ncbi:MAG: tRNA preQ1(34) S-adenosylmethionine ribosyltransferase-isomerase QueA [Acidobacteriota bacterium]|nr:tRNA preQ1(34) S-adenosylmethionine ribosyltransferase-isomerase QueA [Blastocatellia bacterium]MDW8411060.1 tRNA preQ1(34) S-adenosylmethionine ribosyltransferase-isomerase QueA [Acidobacteriota bacterium]
MKVAEFDFDLPGELIAQRPLERRDASRMLVLDRSKQSFTDTVFLDLPAYLNAGDCLVLNNTRVFPARLLGRRVGTDSQVEVLLVKEHDSFLWEALVKPGRAFKIGSKFILGQDRILAEVVEILANGHRMLRLNADTDIRILLEEVGLQPLPPYIKRYRKPSPEDRQAYQTIYAKETGSIAAPTAGLHFTQQVLDRIAQKGVHIVSVTHHVGYATFQPVKVENVEDHKIGDESYYISPQAADLINLTRAHRRRVVAVGTTSTRALESAADSDGRVRFGHGNTELFIYPGYKFKVIDALFTNFHLPKSSLLMLVSAFAGKELVLEAYRHAVRQKYRFYSYGDCMLII